jgi:WD40 repeat protein
MFLQRWNIAIAFVFAWALMDPAAATCKSQKKDNPDAARKTGDKAEPAWKLQSKLQVGRARVEAFAISPDGKHLVCVGGGGLDPSKFKTTKEFRELFAGMNPKLWDAATGSEKGVFKWDAKATQTDIGALTFAPDGKTLATSSTGVGIWDVKTMKLRRLISDKPATASVVFAADGKTLVTLRSDGMAAVYEVETGNLRKSVPVYKLPLQAKAIAPDGRSIFIALAFSGDGQNLTCADAYGVVKVWDLASGKAKSTQTIKTAGRLVLSPNGTLAAAITAKGTIEIWDLATRKRQAVLKETVKGIAKLRLAFSADGKTLASAGADAVVSVWDLTSQKRLARLKGHKAAVNNLAFTADGNVLASTDERGVAIVWVAKKTTN